MTMNKKTITWAYGITTIPERIDTYLPTTLNSLKVAGFTAPRLFIDDCEDIFPYCKFNLPITNHCSRIRIAGNWVLSLYELYIREPNATYFGIFQDDFITSPGLREYLEWCEYPAMGYWNLYTFPCNQKRVPKDQIGWFKSNQMGKGAVALILSNEAVITLLGSTYIVKRFKSVKRGHHAIDGGIIDAFKLQGWKEYCHNPSLVQHTGDVSSHGTHNHQHATSFRGEIFNMLDLTL